MALPPPVRSPVSSYLNRLAVSIFLAAVAKAPKARSLAASPAAMVAPNNPIAAASKNTVPLTRPSVIGCGFPCLTTRIAASIERAFELSISMLVARDVCSLTAVIANAPVCAPSGGSWAAHQPDPARAGQGVEAQCDESQRDDAQDNVSKGLGEQEHEGPAEAL